jgi:hypothetical protein
MSAIIAAKREFSQPFFMEVLITALWNIWKQRNAKIFEHVRPTFAKGKANFVHDLYLLQHRIKTKFRAGLLSWIENLP